ncbi:Demethylmacrocin O-methyltransferase [Lacunisphaera limnophila]|uniref:Demethylmacrocin O-methyltransferase n=1 Tax=Lacunisphaera limnophila TaxID=1838286 RepID=A0A1D8AVL6_9BACT|nr:class I SAM-dependent methyltransferase [Lacunisphaera limnophila]AOS44937.1 Demethylmacrocin O-methyltransferase [Lacunisphaera limnophila]
MSLSSSGKPAGFVTGFDENFYLAAYPDVAAAVQSGRFASGREHYERYGLREGRTGSASPTAAWHAAASRNLVAHVAGRAFTTAADWSHPATTSAPPAVTGNALAGFFAARRSGRGIWKWQHYFEIYERHFARFRGQPVNVLEIGVYSGGSLEMWRDYFGPQARLHGVDIEPACKAYEGDGVKIMIGDQTDRNFWRDFRTEVPALDIVIDDGGHLYDQQRVTLEELLPHVRPGGVYLCEDIHGEDNAFAAYATGLAAMLSAGEVTGNSDDPDRRLVCRTSPFQASIRSVSFYPQVVAIEKLLAPVAELVAPKRGTQWQPFLH